MLWTLPLLAAAALADDAPTVTPIVQVRPRLEAHTGRDGNEATDGPPFVTQRSRLGANIALEDASARVVIQDVRTWGTETDSLGDYVADAVDFHEAWLAWAPADAFQLKVGRQEIAFHEHRLVGTVNWAQQGRSFDAARVSGKSGAISWDVVGAKLYEGTAIDPATIAPSSFMLRGGYANDGTQADLIAIVDYNSALLMKRQTLGVYAKGGSGPMSGRVEAYYQMGSQGDAGTIGAYMAGVSATFAPDAKLKPKATLWFDQLSGDDNVADGEIKAFNTLYATNHKFYGLIDMAWFGKGGHKDGKGLQDAALKLSASPVKGVGVNLDVHMLRFADAQGGDAGIAKEIDLTTKVDLAKHLGMAVGGAVWLPDYEASSDMWGFVQLNAQY